MKLIKAEDLPQEVVKKNRNSTKIQIVIGLIYFTILLIWLRAVNIPFLAKLIMTVIMGIMLEKIANWFITPVTFIITRSDYRIAHDEDSIVWQCECQAKYAIATLIDLQNDYDRDFFDIDIYV